MLACGGHRAVQQAHRMQLGLPCLRVPSLRAQAPLLTAARAYPGAAKGQPRAPPPPPCCWRCWPAFECLQSLRLCWRSAWSCWEWQFTWPAGCWQRTKARPRCKRRVVVSAIARMHALLPPGAFGQLRARPAATCDTRRASHAKRSVNSVQLRLGVPMHCCRCPTLRRFRKPFGTEQRATLPHR